MISCWKHPRLNRLSEPSWKRSEAKEEGRKEGSEGSAGRRAGRQAGRQAGGQAGSQAAQLWGFTPLFTYFFH